MKNAVFENIENKDLAFAGLFGAAALVLPFLFHLIPMGKIFLPMYLPLVALAFFAKPQITAITAFVVPILSAILTGMPPFYPPVAFAMAFELTIMTFIISWIWQRWKQSVLVVLIPVLFFGRLLQLGLGFIIGLFLDLPPEFLSVVSVLAGLPGIVLICVTIPALVHSTSYKSLKAS